MLKAGRPAFAVQVAPIRSRLLAGTVIGSDETRFRVGKANWWLWVFQNADSCCFLVEPGRDKAEAGRFLGGASGSLTGWARRRAGARSTKPVSLTSSAMHSMRSTAATPCWRDG